MRTFRDPVPVGDPLLKNRVVLVVEDSSLQREHLLVLVRALGPARLLEAADGVEALAILAREPAIDLVLTDLEMPRMDGITFIGELAARGFRPEVIIVSSQEHGVLHSVRLMAQTYGLRVPGILAKPLTSEGLIKLLNQPAVAEPAFRAPSTPVLPDLAAIRQGLREGEFCCFFQPQITLKGALMQGAEALVRWRHPHLGLLGPNAFLPQVERDEEAMAELTLAVLEYVSGFHHEWKRKGLALDLSVNLSALSLGTAHFADRIMEACERLDLPPRSLILEVTESASVSNLGHTLANLARLRMRGFGLSIDDFGTGFATFEQLERIPFTELKIDQSITRSIATSERHSIMAKRLLQMARDLKLTTVAEGIETLEAWQALKALGCDRAQGYLIARPMPGAQLGEWSLQDRQFLRR